MTRNNWYSAIVIISVIVLVSLTGGCMLTASSQGPAAVPASAPVTPEISNPSPETQAISGPATDQTLPPEQTLVGSDPVSGQGEEVDLRWEQLCLSAEYQVQIAKDPDFRILVVDTGPYAPASLTSPGAYYPAGGQASSPSSLTGWSNLEAAHTYYWRVRVRQAASGQHILSPWSEVQSFTVKPGTQIASTSYGIQPIYPNNGLNTSPIKSVSFSWSPLNDTTEYRFVLAKDAAMTQVLADANVTTTAYNYEGQLDYGQVYFWRLMALEPAPSDWSTTFSFRTEAAPTPPAIPMPPTIPMWVWFFIAIGLILIVVVIVLIFIMRRR